MSDYAVLVVNGHIEDINYYENIFKNAKLVVCSDGGANFLVNTKINVDYIVGDLDSISDDTLLYYEDKNVIIKRYPVKKDKTDSEISIDIIKEKNIDKIIMLGAFGNRIDHFLSNVNLLYYADKMGIQMSIIDENNDVSLLNKRENYIDVNIGQTISFVSISGSVMGIKLRGFEYELENFNLESQSSILTSNIAKEDNVFVGIEQGSLLCIKINGE